MNSEHIYHPNKTVPYPPSLTCNDQWSLMKLAWSEEKQKFSKTPIDIKTGSPANCDCMGVPFDVAEQHLDENTVLNYRHPDGSTMYLGLIDDDHCVGPDGSISPRSQKLLRYMDTYAEYSVSDGIHILCWLDAVPPDGHKDRQWDMEFYWQARSIPITGNRVVLADWRIANGPPATHAEVPHASQGSLLERAVASTDSTVARTDEPSFQDQILSRLFCEQDGEKWADIYAGNWQGHYESPSDADLALLMKFAFYGGKDRQDDGVHVFRTPIIEDPHPWDSRTAYGVADPEMGKPELPETDTRCGHHQDHNHLHAEETKYVGARIRRDVGGGRSMKSGNRK